VDDLAAAQDWRARNIGGIKPLQPFSGGVLSDIFGHLVDTRGGIDRTRRRRRKARILGKFGIAGGPAEPCHSESEMVPAVM